MKGLHTDLQTFASLHDYLKNIHSEELNEWIYRAEANNPWFTAENVKSAIDGIIDLIEPVALEKFYSSYTISSQMKKVGVIMAGNIPAVGFHDLLCVVLSGNILYAKLSSDDSVILKKITEVLVKINSSFQERIFFVDQLKNMDAYIATGSDNSAKHFEYYFRNTPNIIRKNRTSVVVINGDEDTEKLILLGEDVFNYFGLGCRNVSHLYLPEGYSPTTLLRAWEGIYNKLQNHHKYMNNYEYNKAVLLIDQVHHFDSGYVLLKESDSIFSQIATLTYSFYRSKEELASKLVELENQLQCIVSSKETSLFPTVRIGKAQHPSISDFADGVDTMKFLINI
ncbi:acyl-CoA reductase [Cytophaga aurantiaca]|uniref:acyl-CoA reductase n=1 Tax=Cytophaga aurantiaca TaxID=29530 RepID=UPI00036199F9|nr:acyl-CoA reductase [Cytophaga aurantiaca]